MRTLVVLLLITALTPAVNLAQTSPQAVAPVTPRPHKVLTPEQVAFQQALKDYNAQMDKLRATALGAYSAEMAREKVPECPDAGTTYAINMCLVHEGEITDANYKTFTRAVRAMLALPGPAVPGLPMPVIGPSGPEGTPATNTAAFDKAEAAWQTYARAECDAVDTYWRGGTIVNAMDGECGLRLSRARMKEADDLYSVTHPR
jgi:uncharacterized protein YecT (DUF1311 family)